MNTTEKYKYKVKHISNGHIKGYKSYADMMFSIKYIDGNYKPILKK
jgi:hypothetical protein